jgi:nitrogen regulatory protein P-II 1
MKRVEAIVRQDKFDEIMKELERHQFYGVTTTKVLGCGLQKADKKYIRGVSVEPDFIPKIRLELIIKDHWLDELVDVILKKAHTGKIGDGKIFVFDIGNTYRIRTGEVGEMAID